MIVTQHARERWIERVDPSLTLAQAAAAIRAHEHAVAAAAIGCRYVRLATWHRLVLQGDTVVSVLAPGQNPDICLSRPVVRA